MKEYKMLDKDEVRKEILYDFKNRLSFDFSLCDFCDGEKCYLMLTNKEECFQPMRELYDEKYALEG